MNDEELEQLVELFAETPVGHGQVFDDGRRWCAQCAAPRIMVCEDPENLWKSRSCQDCSALWPEFALEFMQLLAEDDDFINQFEGNFRVEN